MTEFEEGTVHNPDVPNATSLGVSESRPFSSKFITSAEIPSARGKKAPIRSIIFHLLFFDVLLAVVAWFLSNDAIVFQVTEFQAPVGRFYF